MASVTVTAGDGVGHEEVNVNCFFHGFDDCKRKGDHDGLFVNTRVLLDNILWAVRDAVGCAEGNDKVTTTTLAGATGARQSKRRTTAKAAELACVEGDIGSQDDHDGAFIGSRYPCFWRLNRAAD